MRIHREQMSAAFTKFHIPVPGVLHRFTEPDHGSPHDHPFGFWSTIIHGGYAERVFCRGNGSSRIVRHNAGERFFVEATHIHQIVELTGGECWTFIEPGPAERTSGFWRWEDGRAWFRPWNGDWVLTDEQ